MDALITLLRSYRSPNVFNPWSDIDPFDVDPGAAAKNRCLRLMAHMHCTPDLILVGEAPGYQGCRFSGVPFTNESLILEGKVPRVTTHGERITTRSKPWCEPSATIVWNLLHDLHMAHSTVMWNAFAWHPHKPNETLSNRAPTDLEARAGATALRVVVGQWKHTPVVAVGKVAQRMLGRLGIRCAAAVRHPSMGGATEFRSQLTDFITGG
jgi:uracil-DNA glycosylase